MRGREQDRTDLSFRHALATLAYRASKATRDAPPEFGRFRPAPGTRCAGDILTHMCDLMDWALSQVKGQERWRNSKLRSWDLDVARFFEALTALDSYLASGAAVHAATAKVFQGAIADALTHVGQMAMLRRLAGAPVRGENYYRAKIKVGRTGADQNRPVREFN